MFDPQKRHRFYYFVSCFGIIDCLPACRSIVLIDHGFRRFWTVVEECMRQAIKSSSSRKVVCDGSSDMSSEVIINREMFGAISSCGQKYGSTFVVDQRLYLLSGVTFLSWSIAPGYVCHNAAHDASQNVNN